MIAGPWRGDTVIYVGDYWTEGSFDDERSHRLFTKFDGYPYEDILKRFENVTGRFEEARGRKHGDYLHFEERGDVFDEPYTGPFDLRVRSWRYAVNRTRREFVDRRQGPISKMTLAEAQRRSLAEARGEDNPSQIRIDDERKINEAGLSR